MGMSWPIRTKMEYISESMEELRVRTDMEQPVCMRWESPLLGAAGFTSQQRERAKAAPKIDGHNSHQMDHTAARGE